jgi:hypothetical protein
MRQFVVVEAEEGVLNAYRAFLSDDTRIRERLLDGVVTPPPNKSEGPLLDALLRIVSELPFERPDQRAELIGIWNTLSIASSPTTLPDDPANAEWANELVVSFEAAPDAIERLHKLVVELAENHVGTRPEMPPVKLRNIGADPRGHFCNLFAAASARPFGNRSRVRDILGFDALHAGNLKGRGVNVVIIDQGLNAKEIKARNPKNWGGGLARRNAIEPGSAPRTSHGMMIARNVLDIAPEATLYDVPMIPPHIVRPGLFASDAHATFREVLDEIGRRRKRGHKDSVWILVNAWGVFDRAGEWPPGDYTCNTRARLTKFGWSDEVDFERGHPFNNIMNDAVGAGIDVLFGAGNCGRFTASSRCGRLDRGEGRSIWGANAHPAVLTIGAVSADGQWLGYSSEGPGGWGLEGKRTKPDVCAPSHFCEDHDAAMLNSGTSAATGLAAGVVAAVRSNPKWGPKDVPPTKLKVAINDSARGQGGNWNARTGHGILDARALLGRLSGSH